MGFPGRLNEKKKFAYGFWMIAAVVVAMICWGVWGVMQVVRTPLTPQQQREIYTKPPPGYVQKKVDRLEDNLGQIRKGAVMKPIPERAYSGRAVNYEAQPDSADKKAGATEPADYYSSGR